MKPDWISKVGVNACLDHQPIVLPKDEVVRSEDVAAVVHHEVVVALVAVAEEILSTSPRTNFPHVNCVAGQII
jgi:hypothetical protein